jgi:hypothetical protein
MAKTFDSFSAMSEYLESVKAAEAWQKKAAAIKAAEAKAARVAAKAAANKAAKEAKAAAKAAKEAKAEEAKAQAAEEAAFFNAEYAALTKSDAASYKAAKAACRKTAKAAKKTAAPARAAAKTAAKAAKASCNFWSSVEDPETSIAEAKASAAEVISEAKAATKAAKAAEKAEAFKAKQAAKASAARAKAAAKAAKASCHKAAKAAKATAKAAGMTFSAEKVENIMSAVADRFFNQGGKISLGERMVAGQQAELDSKAALSNVAECENEEDLRKDQLFIDRQADNLADLYQDDFLATAAKLMLISGEEISKVMYMTEKLVLAASDDCGYTIAEKPVIITETINFSGAAKNLPAYSVSKRYLQGGCDNMDVIEDGVNVELAKGGRVKVYDNAVIDLDSKEITIIRNGEITDSIEDLEAEIADLKENNPEMTGKISFLEDEVKAVRIDKPELFNHVYSEIKLRMKNIEESELWKSELAKAKAEYAEYYKPAYNLAAQLMDGLMDNLKDCQEREANDIYNAIRHSIVNKRMFDKGYKEAHENRNLAEALNICLHSSRSDIEELINSWAMPADAFNDFDEANEYAFSFIDKQLDGEDLCQKYTLKGDFIPEHMYLEDIAEIQICKSEDHLNWMESGKDKTPFQENEKFMRISFKHLMGVQVPLDPENLGNIEDTYNWRGADVVLDEQGQKFLAEFSNQKQVMGDCHQYLTKEAVIYHAYMENGLEATFDSFSRYTWYLVADRLFSTGEPFCNLTQDMKIDLSGINLKDICNVKSSRTLGIFEDAAVKEDTSTCVFGKTISEPTELEKSEVLTAAELIRAQYEQNMEMVCSFKANAVTWTKAGDNYASRTEELTTLNYIHDNLYKFENGDILIAIYGHDDKFCRLEDRVDNIKRATALASIAGERAHALFMINNGHQSDSTLDILFDRYQTLDSLYPTMEELVKAAHIEAEICFTIGEELMGTWVKQAFVSGYNAGSREANLVKMEGALMTSSLRACKEVNREVELTKQIDQLTEKAESIKEEARRLEGGHVAPASEARSDRFVKTGRMSASEIAEAMDEEDDFIDTQKMWDEVEDLYNEANELQKDLEFDAWYLINK